MTLDLENALGLPREITVAGEVLTLKPLRIGQLPAFVRTISPVITSVSTPPIDWLQLLGDHGDAVLAALAIALDRPRAWVEQLEAGDALWLISQVIEVNADFFTRQVLPQLDRLLPATPGSTPSSA